MPNQRAKDKIFLGGFMLKTVYRTIGRMAREAGMANNRSGFLLGLAMPAIKRYERKGKLQLKSTSRKRKTLADSKRQKKRISHRSKR